MLKPALWLLCDKVISPASVYIRGYFDAVACKININITVRKHEARRAKIQTWYLLDSSQMLPWPVVLSYLVGLLGML
jgi:hypothetical protein